MTVSSASTTPAHPHAHPQAHGQASFPGPDGGEGGCADGDAPRARLLAAAVRLFAEQGYAKASVRQIATAARVNVAAISYYFGDKQGLYRAAFSEPMGSARDDIALFSDPAMTLRDALQGLYAGFVMPLKQDEQVQLCTRLHMREMVEPTGMWAEEIDNGIRPYQAELVTVLCRHLGLAQADDDLHRLAFAIVSQGVFLFMGRDVIQAIRPHLLGSPEAIDAWAARFTDNALAMVDAERQRRQLPLPIQPPTESPA
ncbi:MAG: CerR family C-terminal domain-containing protein [Burkholderiaceae bacterium]|nr:CerR family C-terminal domain-containing protein [Burkholderiaceae bacterium]MDP3422793.1 CerR family C-terminal domain-containing protein [Burkholderiaceae bacterium]MDZ4163158.1 CerR family C-terminal domain-containing protein [Burkholderiales bacterium]